MNSFAWTYIDKYICTLDKFFYRISSFVFVDSKKVKYMFRVNTPMYVSLGGGIASLVLLRFDCISKCTICLSIITGLFSSFSVAFLMEFGNNYRRNMRCEIGRRSYHKDLNEYVSAVDYSVMMSDGDIVQGIWSNISALSSRIICYAQNKSHLFSDGEYLNLADIEARYLEIVKAVELNLESVNNGNGNCCKELGVLEYVEFYRNEACKVLCSKKSIDDMFGDQYRISEKMLSLDIPVSPEVRFHRNGWSKEIASKLISINCKFIYENIVKLQKCDDLWMYK